MERLLSFFGVSIFFKVFSFKLELVLKLFINIEGLILRYHAIRNSDQYVFCKNRGLLNFVKFTRKYL